MASGRYWVFVRGGTTGGSQDGGGSYGPFDLTSPDLDYHTTHRTLVRTRLWVAGESHHDTNDTPMPWTGRSLALDGNDADTLGAWVTTANDGNGGGAALEPTSAFNPDYYPGSSGAYPLGPVLYEPIEGLPPVYVPPSVTPGVHQEQWWRQFRMAGGMGNSEGKRRAEAGFPLSTRVHIGAHILTGEIALSNWAFFLQQLVEWADA